MESIFNHLINTFCSEKGYSSLLKASIVLIGTALLAMSQVMPFLYEKDISAHRAKFALEASIKQPIEKADCFKQVALQADCLSTKHELKTLNSSISLLDTVVRNSFWFGVAIAAISAAGFLCAPFAGRPSEPKT